jgi:nickel-dependent lactate racemase
VTDSIQLRSDAWYGDQPFELSFPETWTVTTLRPSTPPPLSDRELAQAFEHPVGQAPIRELAAGKRRPLIIVDDLTRPTPAERVLPHILRQLGQAGVPASDVRVVIGSGTHAPPSPTSAAKKVGSEAAAACQILAHDQHRGLVRVGRTSFGTPVLVNPAVSASDLVIGVGGVYPQHTTGFGGGSKLAIGVLGRKSITALHYGHRGVGGSYNVDNDFRRDMDDIAGMIGLNTIVTLHVDANRDIVRIVTGDHIQYYREAVRFSIAQYAAPPPGEDVDVVVANAYPMDVSLTFVHSKGMIPIFRSAPAASRVVIAGCSEGIGQHGLFPFMNVPRFQRERHLARRLSVMKLNAVPAAVVGRVVPRIRDAVRRRSPMELEPSAEQQRRTWLYPPGRQTGALPAEIPGLSAIYQWSELLARIQREQARIPSPQVFVYACAPLQVLVA